MLTSFDDRIHCILCIFMIVTKSLLESLRKRIPLSRVAQSFHFKTVARRDIQNHANAEQIVTAKCPIKDDGNAKGAYDEHPVSTDQSSSDEDPMIGGDDHTAQGYMVKVPIKKRWT